MLKVHGDMSQLEESLGQKFEKRELLMQALTHSSATAENAMLPCNERLEFLGDTVLQMVVTDYIFRHYPQIPEGQLTRMRAAAVSEPSLAKLAETLNLGEYLIMGKGAGSKNGRHLPSVLSDAMEAVVAAIYLEAGKKYEIYFNHTCLYLEPLEVRLAWTTPSMAKKAMVTN